MRNVLLGGAYGMALWGLLGIGGYSCVQPIDPPEGGPVKAPVVEEEIGYIYLIAGNYSGVYYCSRNEVDEEWPLVVFNPLDTSSSTVIGKLKEAVPWKYEIGLRWGASLRVRIRRLPSYCICREMGDDPPLPIHSYPVMGQFPIIEVVEILEE